MKYTEEDLNLDKIIDVLNNDYAGSKDVLSLIKQNVLGFSIAMFIQYNRDKLNNGEEFTRALLHSSFWCLLIDNLIINRRINKYESDKKEAFERIHEITSNLKYIGINVEESDVLHSIKESINSKIDYYYMIDMFNNIVSVSKTELKTGLFKKTIIWGEGIDGYNYVSFYKIGSIVTDKDENIKAICGKEKINKEDYKDIKTYYELGFKQDENIGIITFCKDNDDIRIIHTEGDIEKASTKEKYLRIGLVLQSIDYKNSYEINGIIKKKIMQ